MKLILINPNSTQSMTDKIVAAARLVAPAGVALEGRTCHASPPAIETPEDDALAAVEVLREVRAAEADGADAVVIACFDDPGLVEAREAVAIPVVGIGQAAYHAAALLGRPWSVVTTTEAAVPGMTQNIRDHGLDACCENVRACNIRVLDLEEPGSEAQDSVSREIEDAMQADGARSIALGCAGMADLSAMLTARHGITVIDGVTVATQLALMLAGLRAPLAARPAAAE